MEKMKNFIKNNKFFLIVVLIAIIAFILIVVVNKSNQNQDEKADEYAEQLENISKAENTVLTVPIEKKNEVQAQTFVMDDIYNGYPIVGKIEIPKTGLNIPIITNVSVGGMKEAPCVLYTTGELNKSGNTLIVGHNYMNGTLFSDNGKLANGDKIKVTTLDGTVVEYTIYNKFVTTSEDVSYLKRETTTPEITIQSCTDDNNDDRLIIEAK